MEMRISSATMAVLYRRIETYNPRDSMYHIVLQQLTSLLVTVMGWQTKEQTLHSSFRNQSLEPRINQFSSRGTTSHGVVPNNVGRTQDISRRPDKPQQSLDSHHYNHHNMQKGTRIQIRIRNYTMDMFLLVRIKCIKQNSMNLVNHIYVLTMQLSKCYVNACGQNSKWKYNVLQDYMQQFDAVCLAETKCDAIVENKMVGFEFFIMTKS